MFLTTYRDPFSKLFDTNESFSPTTDIQESDKEYTLEMELPGIKKEDISVEVKDGYLTVSGEKKKETKSYKSIESFHGSFSRSWKVSNIDYDNVKAEYKDGILAITIPKKEKDKKLIAIT